MQTREGGQKGLPPARRMKNDPAHKNPTKFLQPQAQTFIAGSFAVDGLLLNPAATGAVNILHDTLPPPPTSSQYLRRERVIKSGL